MALDVQLVLASAVTITVDGNSDYIECEGGGLVWVRIWFGAMSGGTSIDIRVMASLDAGSNYYMFGKFQQLVPTNDNSYMAIPVYLPRPTSAANKLRVRLNYDVTGAMSTAITNAVIDPMTSLAVPEQDERNQNGAVSLLAAV